jgi:hypothetical protein
MPAPSLLRAALLVIAAGAAGPGCVIDNTVEKWVCESASPGAAGLTCTSLERKQSSSAPSRSGTCDKEGDYVDGPFPQLSGGTTQQCCYVVRYHTTLGPCFAGIADGRPLLVEGRVRVAPLRAQAGWNRA